MHSMDSEDALRLYVGGTGATAPHAMSNKLTPAACKLRGSARDTAGREHKAGAHKAKGHAISRSRKKSSSPSQAALRQLSRQSHLRGERTCMSTTATMHANIANVHINSDARPQVTMHHTADAHSNIVWAAHLELVRPRRTRRRHRRHKPELVGYAKVRRCAVCAASQASEGCDEDRASCRHRCHPRRSHRQTD
jgi:hypothetical protein